MQDSGNDLWKIFFLRAVLVPPNRYRPIAKIGEETKEHPQNVHLTKIIESNMRIRLLQHGVDTSSFQKELIQTQNDKLKASKQEVCLRLPLRHIYGYIFRLFSAVLSRRLLFLVTSLLDSWSRLKKTNNQTKHRRTYRNLSLRGLTCKML